jgi:hypothetical protein
MPATNSVFRRALVIAGLFTVVASASALRGAPAWRHTHLTKSEPAGNDTLANSPRMVKLWFSEQVELAVTTVKLADAAGAPVALDPVARPDTGEASPVVTAINKQLAPGGYVVTWSTAAKDGHPANGTFSFIVKPAR